MHESSHLKIPAAMTRIKRILHRFRSASNKGIVNLGTLPYYRFFRQNTLLPILNIAEAKGNGASDQELVRLLTNWRQRKIEELRFIQAASALLAAAVIGCFSWTSVPNEYWLGPAFWYSSLVLSILSILLSSSQAFLFNALGDPTLEDYHVYLKLMIIASDERLAITQELPVRDGSRLSPNMTFAPRWKMMFTWQCPMMFMAYSVCFFGGGLTIYVCTPLFNGEVFTSGGKTGIFFLVISAVAGSTFVYCSFWASKFIDFERSVRQMDQSNLELPMRNSILTKSRFTAPVQSSNTTDPGRRSTYSAGDAEGAEC